MPIKLGIFLEKNQCRVISAPLVAIKVSFLRVRCPFFFSFELSPYTIIKETILSQFSVIPLMRTQFNFINFSFSMYTCSVMTMTLVVFFQISVCDLWADEKSGAIPSLDATIELASKINSQGKSSGRILSPEEVIFKVKKYYYQIQIQSEQLETAEEVKGYFQKAVDKADETLDEGEGGVSQSDVTKLKLGLSDTLNNIISLKHDMQVARLHLGQLIGRELGPDIDMTEADVMPVTFSYNSFDDYVKVQSPSPSTDSSVGKVRVASSKNPTRVPVKLSEENRLILHEKFIKVKEAQAKVSLGKNNRKITRALLVSEVANYDFGIGDSQDLFEALIIYARVLSGYLDSIYTLNVTAAELEKLTTVIFK